jgi:hypothetical protein
VPRSARDQVTYGDGVVESLVLRHENQVLPPPGRAETAAVGSRRPALAYGAVAACAPRPVGGLLIRSFGVREALIIGPPFGEIHDQLDGVR